MGRGKKCVGTAYSNSNSTKLAFYEKDFSAHLIFCQKITMSWAWVRTCGLSRATRNCWHVWQISVMWLLLNLFMSNFLMVLFKVFFSTPVVLDLVIPVWQAGICWWSWVSFHSFWCVTTWQHDAPHDTHAPTQHSSVCSSFSLMAKDLPKIIRQWYPIWVLHATWVHGKWNVFKLN